MLNNNISFHSYSDQEIKKWRDSLGNTKLHIASWEGNLEDVKFLIEKVDITIKNKHGNTALHFATRKSNNSEVIKKLARPETINIGSKEGFTALHYAAGLGITENVEALLEFSADFTIPDNDGRTALHIAAKEGKTEAVEALLKKAESELVDNTQGKYSELVDNTQGKYTALHLAAEYGHHKVGAKLIEFGADFNKTDNCGLTALHMAVEKGNTQVVKVLIDEGANVDIKNKKGETAIDIANKIEDESNRDTITGLLSGSNRIKIEGLLNPPPSASEKRPHPLERTEESANKKLRANQLSEAFNPTQRN